MMMSSIFSGSLEASSCFGVLPSFITNNISARTHPRPHMSIWEVYSSCVRIISGDLYHLELICVDNLLCLSDDLAWFYCLTLFSKTRLLFILSWFSIVNGEASVSSWLMEPDSMFISTSPSKFLAFDAFSMHLAWPKSQSLTWQFWSMRRLPGLMSLCMIPAEWIKLKEHSKLYRMITTWD